MTNAAVALWAVDLIARRFVRGDKRAVVLLLLMLLPTLEACMFPLEIGAILAIPALSWVLIAESRLKRFPADFRAINSGLWLLFLVFAGTLGFPPIVAVAFGTDLTSLWAMQGLFLIAILVVCGASYPIERFYTVNLAVLVIGIALVAVTVAAPLHAFYRNTYGYGERRNFYRLAALELTRRWHQVSHSPLPAISGDNALAFATAFYSPDHPRYRRPFALQYQWPIPPQHAFVNGWGAMCFNDDEVCGEWIQNVRATAPDAISFDFVVTGSLWGQRGVTGRIVAVMVLPRDGKSR
jgi:hypothetical protein